MTAFMLCCAVLSVMVNIIWIYRSGVGIHTRVQTSVISALFAVYLIICDAVYPSLSEQSLYNVSENYSYIFIISLTVISLLPILILQMAHSFKRYAPKFTHFWGFFTLYIALLIGLIVNCWAFNKAFRFLVIFVPLHLVFFMLMLSSIMLDMSKKAEFISGVCINGVLCGLTLAMLIFAVWDDLAGGMISIASIVMTAAVLLLTLISVLMPIFAHKSAGEKA